MDHKDEIRRATRDYKVNVTFSRLANSDSYLVFLNVPTSAPLMVGIISHKIHAGDVDYGFDQIDSIWIPRTALIAICDKVDALSVHYKNQMNKKKPDPF